MRVRLSDTCGEPGPCEPLCTAPVALIDHPLFRAVARLPRAVYRGVRALVRHLSPRACELATAFADWPCLQVVRMPRLEAIHPNRHHALGDLRCRPILAQRQHVLAVDLKIGAARAGARIGELHAWQFLHAVSVHLLHVQRVLHPRLVVVQLAAHHHRARERRTATFVFHELNLEVGAATAAVHRVNRCGAG